MAIPEFILRKLILPGSLKPAGNGFEFVMFNTFAPATINSFALQVSGKEVPASKIQIFPKDKDSFSAVSVTKENPLLAAVNVEIAVKVADHPLDGAVFISVDTKEVGPLQFTLADSLKKKEYKRFKPAWTALFRKSLKAEATIDTRNPLGEASPFLLGQFVEHLERCVYDGIWTKDGSSLRQDTVKLLNGLKIPMIRYPGGNFASGYHWEDGIGPKEKRPVRHDAAWQAEEINQVGTDEFLTFCEEMDIEPYLAVNDGSGTAEEAARWVAYCNSPQDTEQGQRRAANGHPQPYNVKYWGIGNEVWGPWQIGTTSAQEYVRRLQRFITAMKAVDPTIKLIAVGNNPLTDDPQEPGALWNSEVLSAAADFDYLSWHIYQPEQDSWKESYDPYQLFGSVCAAPLDFEEIIHRVDRQIQASSGKNRVTQCIDEWNLWLPPLADAKSMHQVTYTMRDALYVAGILNTLFKNFDKVDIANLAQLVNVLPLIKTNESSAFATSIYFPFVLAADMEEMVLNVRVKSPTYASDELGQNVRAHQEVPYVDIIATRNKESDCLTALIVNRSPENRVIIGLHLSENDQYSSLSIKEITAAFPDSSNTFEHPNEVKIHERKSITVDSAEISLVLRPASVTFCKFTK
jgi:alpha-N-arabinofuranosidase